MSTPKTLLLALLLITSLACETQQRANTTETTAKATEPVTTQQAAAAPTTPSPVDGEGQSCFNDMACKGYLRCIQKKCSVPPAISGVRDEKTPQIHFRRARQADSEPIRSYYIELALSDSEQARGLMYRRSMLDDWGMIFIYPQDRILAFWMKNTYISLDMLFINSAGKVVCIIEGAAPLTLDSRACDTPASYVLELNAGAARKAGITIHSWMDLSHVEEGYRPVP
jgi:uncharacterized membrane protein (UPF0127 family)